MRLVTIEEIEAMVEYLGVDEDDEHEWPEVGHGKDTLEGAEPDLFARAPAAVRALRQLNK